MSRNARRYNSYVRNTILDIETMDVDHDLDSDVVCPDGRTFWTALEAASALAHHWASAGYVAEWLRGEKNWDPNQFELCGGAVWDEGVDYGWAIWPCTGGCISWQGGQLVATPEKIKSLKEEGIRTYIKKVLVGEHDEELVLKFRRESTIVYSPEGSPFGIPTMGLQTPEGEWIWPKCEAEIALSGAWVHYHKRAPKQYDLVDHDVGVDELRGMIELIARVNLKTWLRYARVLPSQATNHDRLALLKASGAWSAAAMDQLSKYGENWNDIWETFSGIPEGRVPLLKKSRAFEFVVALRKIPADVDLGKLAVAEIVTLATKYLYENVKDESVALPAQVAGLNQQDFEEYQEYWMGRARKEYESIPYVGIVEIEGYRMYRLESDDPRGPLLGIFTNCCQHPEGAGATCARHGMESPDGAFFVVERHGRILAQSWTWRKGSVVCFDNIEALSGDYMPIVAKLYQETADRLVGKLGITQVNVGSGYDDLGVQNYWPPTTPTAAPMGCYSDASSQYCIARKEVVR